MSPVKQRVVEERSELGARLGKLNAFIGTAPFLALAPLQRDLLDAQANVMQRYLTILDERLQLM